MQLHAHRLPTALLIALLCGASIGGTMGLATAQAAEGDVPDSFHVREPMADDRWTYNIGMRMSDGNGNEVTENVVATYWYGDVVPWQDAEGVQHAALAVHEHMAASTGDDQWTDRAVYYVDAVTGESLGGLHNATMSWGTRISIGLLGEVIPASSGTVSAEAKIVDHQGLTPMCALRSPLQAAAPVPLAGGIEIPGTCFAAEGEFGIETSQRFHVQGVERVEGVQALRLASQSDDARADIWLHPDVPVPARIEVSATFDLQVLTETFPDLTLDLEWRLVGFEAGMEPIEVALDLGEDRSVHAIELAPREVWGPNDDGMDIPYRLSEAFLGAVADPTYPDLRDFMRDHPDAAVVSADYFFEDNDDGSRDHIWRYIVRAEDGVHETTSRRTVHEAGTPQATLTSLAGPVERHRNTGGVFLPLAAMFMALPHQLPEDMPTVLSSGQRYTDLHQHAANAYRWDAYCVFGCETTLRVGHTERIHEDGGLTGEGASYSGTDDMLHLDETGHVLARWTWIERGEALGLFSDPPENTVQEPALRVQSVASAAAWQAPPAEAVAGAGAFGLLIGALYWLWPSIKAIPFFGLFSRIQKDDLLDHPVRSQLMHAVETHPGAHYQHLVKEVGKGRGVVEHHLRKLESGGLIQRKRTDGYTCYFAKGRVDNRVMDALPAMKSPTAAKLVESVLARPGVTAKELAATLGISPSTASHHIGRLRQAGLLDKTDGRNAALVPTALAQQALALRLT